MKSSLKLIALYLLVSICILGAVSAKAISSNPPSKNLISFYTLPSAAGVDIKVEKIIPGKVIVIIFDEYANVLLKESLSTDKYLERDYILNKLDNGNYTIEVTSNKKVMKKDFRVYDGQCYIL
jgi:hypothetical protein